MCTRVALSGFMCREVSRPAASALPATPAEVRRQVASLRPRPRRSGRGDRRPPWTATPRVLAAAPADDLAPRFPRQPGRAGAGGRVGPARCGLSATRDPSAPVAPRSAARQNGARPRFGTSLAWAGRGGALRHPRGWAPKAFPRRAPFFLSDPGQHAPSGGTDPSARRQDGDRPRGGLRAPRATSPSRRPLRGAGGTHGGAGPRATCLRPRPEPWPGRGARCLPGYSARPAPPVLPALAAPARSAFSKMVALGSG